MIVDKNGKEVTDLDWKMVETAIATFCTLYPLQWMAFQDDLKAKRTEFQLAQEGDLKKAGWRHNLSFPVAGRPRTKAEIDTDPTAAPVEFIYSLHHEIDRVIPGFTAPDEGTGNGRTGKGHDIKPNKLYAEFQKRYGHLFRPAEKY